MNRRLLILFSIIALSSACKKDWYCSCRTTTNEDVAIIIRSAKEDEAYEVCSTRAERKLEGKTLSSCRLEGKYKEGKY